MATATLAPPILESGDHLTRDEFHRRYRDRPDIKKAELVGGIVYVASPVRSKLHSQPHAIIIAWLSFYRLRAPDLSIDDNATVRLGPDDEVQPDACLWRLESGGPQLSADGYIEGPPQLVVEVAASSASYDLHEKKEAYRRAGVREYVVWRVLDRAVDWFSLRDGDYARMEPDARGVIASTAFPGLRLAVAALLAGDLAGLLAEFQRDPST